MNIIQQQVFNPLYEDLKREIKQFEIHEQLAFDETLQELRRDRLINIYTNTVLEILWLPNTLTMIK